MAEPLSIDINQEVPNTVSIDTGTGGEIVSPETAQMRSVKARFGMVDFMPTKTAADYFKDISTGGEWESRREAGSVVDSYKAANINKNLTGLIGSAAWNEMNIAEREQKEKAVQSAIKNAATPVDPRSVFEETYSKQYVDKLNQTGFGAFSWWKDVEQHEDKYRAMGQSVDALAYREYVVDKMQKIQDMVKNQSTLGWLGDIAKTLVQPYVEYQMRGGGLGEAVGTGSSADAWARSKLALPFDQFKDEVDKVVKEGLEGAAGGNPLITLQRLHYLAGVPTDTISMDNTFTLLNIPDIVAIMKLPIGATKSMVLSNMTRRASRTVAESAQQVPTRTPEVVATAAAGDAKEAAVTQLSKDVKDIKAGTIDRETEAKNAMISTWRSDVKEIDPSRYGQELVNTVKNDTENFVSKIQDASENAIHVERIPEFLADEKAVKAYVEEKMKLHPNFTLLNSGLPERNPATRAYHVPLSFGDKGEYFEKPSQAYHAAKWNNLSLAEEPLLDKINEHFGTESSKLDQQIKDLRRDIKEGPAMEADVHELNRHAALPRKLAELEARLEDLRAWHGEKLTEPGIDKIFLRNTPNAATIEQQGKGFYIRYNLPVDETSNLVRDSLIKGKDYEYPSSIAKDFAGWIRNPDETLSKIDNANRKVVDYAKSRFDEIMLENARYIKDLYSGRISKDPITGDKIVLPKTRAILRGELLGSRRITERFQDWLRTVDAARLLPDADGQPGKFFTIPEFEDFYQQHFQRLPEPIEVQAYSAFKRHYEADLMLRRMLLARNAARMGAESHVIHSTGPAGEIISTSEIIGARRNYLPRAGGAIVDMRGGYGNERILRAGSPAFSGKYGEQITKQIEDSRVSVMEIFNPDQRPLSGFGNVKQEWVRYVIAPRIETRPLNLEALLPRRGAGHIEYDFSHAVKQGIVNKEKIGSTERYNYEGDRTFTLHKNRQEAKDVAEHMEQIRQRFETDDFDSARKYTEDHLPIKWDEMYGNFMPTKDPETGKVRLPLFNKHEPFQAVPKGSMINQMDNGLSQRYSYLNPKTGLIESKFHDLTRSGSMARQASLEFTMERDADAVYTIHNYGTRSNPVYRHEPAPMVDPMTTMSRSINSLANSMSMDDYKITAVERWIKEAGPHLNVGDKAESDLRSSPFYHFYKPEFKTGFIKDDPEKWSALNNRHYQIQSFIGQPSAWDRAIDGLANKMADWTYRTSPVPEGLTLQVANREIPIGRAVQLAPSWALHTVTSAPLYARTFTHHVTLGMYNIAQILAQGANYATLFGLAGPARAAQGTLDAIFHEMHRINPRFLDYWDKMATELGVHRPGDLSEAMREYYNSGFDKVGAEHSMLGENYSPRVITNLGREYLNGAEIFFKGTERFNRMGAFYTAMNEWRAENPTKTITNLDRVNILYQANQYAGNMSRSSKSVLQKGPFAFTAQFMGYQMRLAELMTGTTIGSDRVDRAMQRARMVLTYGSLFGFPAAMGLAAFPFGTYARKWAENNGYVVGERWWSTFLAEGIPATTIAYVTGEGKLGDVNKRIASGAHLNIGQRFGSPGFDQINEALNSDIPTMRILAGAPGSKLAGLYNQSSELKRTWMDWMSGNYKPGQLKEADVADILNQIQSFSYTRKALIAAHTGKLYSQNGTILKDNISPMMALIMGVTGTQPQEVADVQVKLMTHRDDLENQKWATTNFNKQYQRYLQAVDDRDLTNAEDFKSKAWYYLKYLPDEKQPDAIARANEDFSPLVARVNQQLYLRNVPNETTLPFGLGPNRKEMGLDIIKRQMQVDELQKRSK